MPDIVKIGFDKRIVDIIHSCGKDILESDAFQREKDFIQHGTTTTYAHSLCVTYISVWLALRSKHPVNMKSVVRGALLHDYFLYDWHNRKTCHPAHAVYHPTLALHNARKDYKLTPKEEDIILHHMFPLTVLPPKSKEAWMVCLADKLCALTETFGKVWVR